MSAAPAISGLKLGMTSEEVLGRFPGSKDDAEVHAALSRPANQFGTLNFLIRPERYANKADFAGITQITFMLLDGRVSNVTVNYSGPNWSHVDKFADKVAEEHDLPPSDQWEPYPGMEGQMKTLTCSDFSIRVFAGGEGGKLNYIKLQDLEADKKLKARRQRASEQANPTPGQ